MRGFVGTLARSAFRGLAPCIFALAGSPVFSGPPDAAITFDLSDSLKLKPASPAPAPLQLQDPGLRGASRTGLDSFLGLSAGRLVFGPSPAPALAEVTVPPRRAPSGPSSKSGRSQARVPARTEAAKPEGALRLTTRMDRGVRPIGEFPTRDWNRVADTDLQAPEALKPAAHRLELGSELGQLAPRGDIPERFFAAGLAGGSPVRAGDSPGEPADPASAARPASPGPKTVEPENADTGPDAMARAKAALADARAQGLRGNLRRAGGESLLVLPDFGTSGFQVGASFSLSGRPLGRIGFNDRSGPFDGQLGTRNRFGLEADDGETLRLGGDVENVDRKPRKDDDGRLWTGVTFNF